MAFVLSAPVPATWSKSLNSERRLFWTHAIGQIRVLLSVGNTMLSCVCVTYGRVQHLQEMIECYLRQEPIRMDTELVIVNTMPEQTLVYEPPSCCGNSVRVINLDKRPSTLGSARNHAIRMSIGDWISVWDDDDIYYPEFLRDHVAALDIVQNARWSKLARSYYMNDFQIVSEIDTTIQAGVFWRRDWQEHPYPAMNHGEDREFWKTIRAQCPGTVYTPNEPRLAFGYGWQNQVHHISGREGRDYDRLYAVWGSKQPHGDIQLQAGWRRDYIADREAWVHRNDVPGTV